MAQAISFNAYASELNASKEKILSERDPTDWALYTYSGNELKVAETGTGGLEELVDEFDENKILYAFAKVKEPISNLYKYVLITWCGEGVIDSRKAYYNYHVNDITRFFRGYHVQIQARTSTDIDPDTIMKRVKDAAGAKYAIHDQPKVSSARPSVTQSNTYESQSTNTYTSSNSSYTPSVPSRPSVSNASYTPPSTIPARPSVSNNNYSSLLSRPSVTTAPSYKKEENNDHEDWSVPEVSDVAKKFASTKISEPSKIEPAVKVTPVAATYSAQAPVQQTQPVVAPKKSTGLRGIAIYQYDAEESNEINLVEDEEITNIVKVDEGWWEGVNASGKRGLFPATYIELVEEVETQPPPKPEITPKVAKSEGKVGVALYDCEAGEANELSFVEGERIVEIDFVSDDWWEGKNAAGVRGLFPANYIELL
ncbi:hypothetical protein HK098_004522 [Nowakowskiella sp. JEL0407]|nr:hypothetical protein HK098_004522 [Nowakowskiella sp. JEL0407]